MSSLSIPAPPGPPAGCIPPPHAKKPRGNPTRRLAPAQPARGLDPRGARAGCPCQAPALRGKLRCRLHGGRSTGPRTPEGLAKIRTARTVHGNYGAKQRAANRYRITLLRRTRVTVAAKRYEEFLPPAFLARLHGYPPELMPPPHPTGGITAAQDQMRRRAVAAAVAPWRQAIAGAREAARAARKQAAAARATDPNARIRPHRAEPRRPRPRHPTPQALLAALLAELLAPERVPAAPDAGLTEPFVRFPAAGRAAPASTPDPVPRRSAHVVPARCAHQTAPPKPPVPKRAPAAPDIRAPEPFVPFPPARPAAAPARHAHTNGQPEPFVPEGRPPRPTSARQNPLYHFRRPALLPRRPGTHTQTASRNPLYQRARPPRARHPRARTLCTISAGPPCCRAGQTRTHKRPAGTLCTRGHTRPAPKRRARTLCTNSRPRRARLPARGCPTAPRGGDGCASSAACTAPRPPATARDRART